MKAKTKNILSLIINVLIIALTVYAMIPFFTSKGDGNMQVTGLSSLKYFTNLSNYFMAFTAASFIPLNIGNIKTGGNSFPRKWYMLKFMAAVSVTVTFLTCVFFLAPINVLRLAPYGIPPLRAYAMMFYGNTFILHFVTPVLSIIGTFLFEKTDSFTKKDCLWAILPVALYAAVYIVMVAFVKGWRDFYGFTFGGKMYLAPVSGAVMFLATWLIARAERRIYLRANKGSTAEAE